ncbi:hypothetical protein B0H11DRAFT_2241833 [Mycena galericulata]|nr:hypothetical protein B0H11DRAFT_2241833 [Mycena galericulata]
MSSRYPGFPVFNYEHLKKYVESDPALGKRTILPETRLDRKEKEEYEVEKIVGHRRFKKGRIQKYLVRWENYGPQFDEWKTERELTNSPMILAEYKKKHNFVMAEILYGNARGEIPESEIGRVGDVTWVGLNCPLNFLPDRAMEYIDNFSYHTASAPTDENGYFQYMEFIWKPDWEQHDRFYRAWIPILSNPQNNSPWFFQLKHWVSETQFKNFIIPEVWRTRMISDLQKLENCVSEIVAKAPFFGKIPRPPVFYLDSLSRTRETRPAANKLAATAKRAALELLGFLYWRISTAENWQEELTKETIAIIESFNLLDYEKRGVLLNLARDWHAMNIPVLLRHNVPILFPWTIREEMEYRFGCLAPSILAAYQAKCQEVGGEKELKLSDNLSRSASYLAICRYSVFLDDPQEEYHIPESANSVIPKKGDKRMIDFPGWAWRPVPSRKWVKFYKQRFHYQVVNGITTFWRFRPLPKPEEEHEIDEDDESSYSEGDDWNDAEESAMEDLDSEYTVREVYKGRCAPRPGQRFHPETGEQITRPYTGNACLEKYTAELNGRIPPSSSSQAFRGAKEAVEDVARQIREDVPSNVNEDDMDVDVSNPPPVSTVGAEASGVSSSQDVSSVSSVTLAETSSVSNPSLLERMSDVGNFPPLPSAKKAAAPKWQGRIPPTEPRGHREYRHLDQRSASSSYTRGRSRSPPPRFSRDRRSPPPARSAERGASHPRRPRTPSPAGGYRKPTELQATRLEAWVQSAARLAGSYTFRKMPDDYRWNRKFLDHAVLLLHNADARVRLRFLTCALKITTVGEVLDQAVLRGIPFRLAIPETSLPEFRMEGSLSAASRILTKSQYEMGPPEAPLTMGRGGAEFAISYTKRFGRVLSLPHARCIVGMGGIFTWLAWMYEEKLVQSYMSGPSIQVVRFGRGWTDGHEEHPLYITHDQLYPHEIEDILGHVVDGQTDRWVWPTPDLLLELCDHYSGEITSELNEALMAVYNEVKDNRATPRSKTQWSKLFRRRNRGTAAPEVKISKSDLEDEEERMDRIFADKWNVVKVRKLNLPGIMRPI